MVTLDYDGPLVDALALFAQQHGGPPTLILVNPKTPPESWRECPKDITVEHCVVVRPGCWRLVREPAAQA